MSTTPPRRKRFERTSTVDPIHVTERDLAICRLLRDNATLTSAHIAARLLPSAAACTRCAALGIEATASNPAAVCRRCNGLRFEGHSAIVERLRKLFHAGLIDRPRSQVELFRNGGQRLVYRLAKGGADLIREPETETSRTDYARNNARVKNEFLSHRIEIEDFKTDILTALPRYPDIAFTDRAQLIANINQFRASLPKPLPPISSIVCRTEKIFDDRREPRRLAAAPDDAFQFTHGGKNYFYLLELDRGTMPVVRSKSALFTHSSLLIKAISYDAVLAADVPRAEFGWQQYRVLFLVPDPARAQTLRASILADQRIIRKHLFLITDAQSLFASRQCATVLAHTWNDPKGAAYTLAPSLITATPTYTPTLFPQLQS